jgi:DNA-binding NarL/FixJ family response regulator
VTERTVKAHLTAVFRKLGISGRLQVAVFMAEHGRSHPPN